MTEHANLFREVKLVTRSLLLSAPNGLSFQSFVNDYRKHNGQEFPYRELGYKSAVDLIMDLPDAVRMEWLPHRGDYLLKGIADESTKHIENLVKKQRKSKSAHRHQPPPRFQKLNKELSRSYIDGTGHPRRTGGSSLLKKVTQHYLSGTVPVKLRSQIRQLVASFEDGLLLNNFEVAFKKQFGINFPYANLGFSSLEDLFRKIPEIVVLQGSGSLLKICPARKKHNEEHDTSLNSTSKKEPEVSEPAKNSAVNGFLDNKHTSINYMDELDGFDSPESLPKCNSNQGSCISRNHCSTFDNTLTVKSRCHELDSFSSVGNGYLSENENCVENNSRTQNDWSGNSFSVRSNYDMQEHCSPKTEPERDGSDIVPISAVSADDGVPEKMKKNFQRILALHPEGVWATEFLDKYNALTRQKLDVSELGYFSFIEMVSALPDIFSICRPDNCKDDWLLLNANYSKHSKKVSDEAPISQKSCIYEEEPEISETLKHNIVTILNHCCKDVPLEEFEKIYRANFNTDLPWAKLGFDSIEAFMVVLSGDIALDLKNVNGKFYVTLHSQAPKYKVKPNVFMGLQCTSSETIPNDAAMSDCSFQKQTLPENLSQYVAVYVATVEHPGQIWIQFRGETTTNALEVLMENLEKVYYGNSGDEYKMPTSFVEVGQVCAVVWPGDENWHRAVVTGIPNKEDAEVLYVDYGSRGSVKKSSLRFLKKEFLCLPTQALKARLAHILPAVGKRWSEASTQVLLKLCSNRPLSALITNTEYEERLSVCLCDVSQESDFHINDFLVKEGYAKAAKDPYCVDDSEEDVIYHMPSSPMNKIQQINANKFPLIPSNYDALAGMMTFAATAQWLSQLSSSGINTTSLPQLLSSLDLSVHRSTRTDSANQHEEIWTEEHREIFEEGDEFYEQLCQSAEEPKVSVKRKTLNSGYVIHVINSNQKPFVSSGDVSSLFGKNVCLEKLLSIKKILIPSVSLESTNNREIFDEIKRYEVKGIKHEGNVARVTLYPLSSVIEILDGLSHPSNVLRKDVANIIKEASDYEDFWQEDDSHNEEYLKSQNTNLEVMSIDELSAFYKDQFDKRNVIIQKMTSAVGPKDHYVEELHCIENNLSQIDAKLKEMTNSGKSEKKTESVALQGTIPKISGFEQTSVQQHHNSNVWKMCPVSHLKELHHTSNAMPKSAATSPPDTADTSTMLSEEISSKDPPTHSGEASTSHFYLQKSPLQYLSKHSGCSNLAKESTVSTSSLSSEQKVPCYYSEQISIKNTAATQGKVPVMPSRPPIRFSSQLLASRRSSPSLFPVRPTSVSPLYSWAGSQSTS